MCGIVGYIGHQQATPVLLKGLRRLEYRGYDSAGVAVLNEGVSMVRALGNIDHLERALETFHGQGTIGIGHTRWATHGVPSETNAHPHTDCTKKFAVVHNGIIENYVECKTILESKGHYFQSQTDTEVLAHLLEDAFTQGASFAETVREALASVRGTYGLAIVSEYYPNQVAVVRMGSPLVVGLGEGEYFIASDPSALLAYTRRVVYLQDGDICVLEKDRHAFSRLDQQEAQAVIEHIDWNVEDIQKNGYAHFMLKEIEEQPTTLTNTLRGRLKEDGTVVLGGLRDIQEQWKNIDRLTIIGCGGAWNAGLVGSYLFEELAGVSARVELASEFRYRHPVLSGREGVLAISQSGETADTLAAIYEAKQQKALTLGIVNMVGSSIARETDAGVYNHAGPEIGVASTKAFLSQITVLTLMALSLGQVRGFLSTEKQQRLARGLRRLPEDLQQILNQQETIRRLAQKYQSTHGLFCLGRKYAWPIAIEGALKIKEIGYIHAEAYAAGEMKHGPIALIEESFPTIVIAPRNSVYEKTLSNVAEIRARGGKVILITDEGNINAVTHADDVLFIPSTEEELYPILTTVPLQLFAYELAIARGNNPDQPRHLAKSVTVE